MAALATGLVELEVAQVRPSLIESLPATVMLGRRDGTSSPRLALTLANSDAHFLLQELEGRDTPRSQAARLTQRVVTACGGSVTAIEIRSAAPGLIRPWVRLSTTRGTVDLPSEPAQALALSVVLGIPLMADLAIFDAPTSSFSSESDTGLAPVSHIELHPRFRKEGPCLSP